MNKGKILEAFLSDLNEDSISWDQFRARCFKGIPDEKGIRALTWRLLLGYLPPEKSGWSEILAEKRASYDQFISDFVVNASQSHEEPNSSSLVIDHPLSLNPGSQWQTYFKDNDVLSQIDKDVRRLYPAISFFQRPTEFPNKAVVSGSCTRLHCRVERSGLVSSSLKKKGLGVQKFETKKSNVDEDYAALSEGSEAHWEVVERILFIYAKLNPGQGYVQGMNEIVGPIYYTFATDPNVQWRDGSQSGIGNMMGQVMEKLNRLDPAVYKKLEELDIRPQYFCFRWLTLLLSQEFDLPDILRIWDSLFADTLRFRFLLYVCCAMILLIRNDLLAGDFSCCMKLLQAEELSINFQNFPPMDVHVILDKALQLSLLDG